MVHFIFRVSAVSSYLHCSHVAAALSASVMVLNVCSRTRRCDGSSSDASAASQRDDLSPGRSPIVLKDMSLFSPHLSSVSMHLVKTHCVAMRLPKKGKKEGKEGTKKR